MPDMDYLFTPEVLILIVIALFIIIILPKVINYFKGS